MTFMAKEMGIEFIGKPFKCLNCTVEKNKKTKIPKESEKCCTVKGEQFYIDISSIKHKVWGNKRMGYYVWMNLLDLRKAMME